MCRAILHVVVVNAARSSLVVVVFVSVKAEVLEGVLSAFKAFHLAVDEEANVVSMLDGDVSTCRAMHVAPYEEKEIRRPTTCWLNSTRGSRSPNWINQSDEGRKGTALCLSCLSGRAR